jgi:hypothetical protein
MLMGMARALAGSMEACGRVWLAVSCPCSHEVVWKRRTESGSRSLVTFEVPTLASALPIVQSGLEQAAPRIRLHGLESCRVSLPHAQRPSRY